MFRSSSPVRRRASIFKAKRVLADWERQLMGEPAYRKLANAPTKAELRERQRQILSTVARRNGMTYDQFMSGLKLLGSTKDRASLTAPENWSHLHLTAKAVASARNAR